VSYSLEGFQNRRKAVLEPGRLPGFFVLELTMNRLQFVFGLFASAIYGLLAPRTPIAAAAGVLHRKTWAKHVETLSSASGRRFEHWIQMRKCRGEYDHLMSSQEALKRRERCANICGLCRHLHSLAVWPDRSGHSRSLKTVEAFTP
jgi:hypothetical protein